MRTLSPRIEPPVDEEEGSTVKTATLAPCVVVKYFPNASIIELFPAPGGPVMPILRHFLALFTRFSFNLTSNRLSRTWAIIFLVALEVSTRVIARASSGLLLLTIPTNKLFTSSSWLAVSLAATARLRQWVPENENSFFESRRVSIFFFSFNREIFLISN